MAEKAVIREIPENAKKKSIETLKVRRETLEYLRKNGFRTIDDVLKRQDEIPDEFRGNVLACVVFSIT